MSEQISRRGMIAAAGAALGGLALAAPVRAGGSARSRTRTWVAGPVSLTPGQEPTLVRFLVVFRPGLILDSRRSAGVSLEVLDRDGAIAGSILLTGAAGNSGLAAATGVLVCFGDGSVRFIRDDVSVPPVWVSTNGFGGLRTTSEEVERSTQFLSGAMFYADPDGDTASDQNVPFVPEADGEPDPSRAPFGWLVFEPAPEATRVSILLPVTRKIPPKLSCCALLNSRGDFVMKPQPIDPDATAQRSVIRALDVTFDGQTTGVRRDTGEALPLVGAPAQDGLLIGLLLPAVQKVRDAAVQTPVQAATAKKKGGGGTLVMTLGYQF